MATKSHAEAFREIYWSNEDIAAFIGAGCSDALRIPLWNKMLLELNRLFKHYNSDDELLQSIESEGQAKVAENLEKKASDRTIYAAAITRLSKPQRCYYTSLHIEILRLTKTIVTTNYDTSFEEALDAIAKFTNLVPDYESQTVGSIMTKSLGRKRCIYHIHGKHTGENYILSTPSYQSQYENNGSGLARLVTTLFAEFNVLFIGFSFNDEYFTKFLRTAMRDVAKDSMRKNALPDHYCILSDDLMREYMLPQELSDMAVLNINDLVTHGLLEAINVAGIKDEVFVFKKGAEKLLASAPVSTDSIKALDKKIRDLANNRKILTLIEDLKIKPIYFKGKNYLDIENILRNIMEPMIATVASSFTPS
jgi:hypothetical protein